MKKIAFISLSICLFVSSAWAVKTTYIATNHRFNYVKLKEVKGGVAEGRAMTHPVKLDEQGLRAALKSIQLSREYLIKKEVDTQQVFDEYAINFLAPNMVKAFAESSPVEEIVISYLSKDPIFILRNDRINIANCWIHENELHIRFMKIFAKITGDVDKRGNEAKAVAKARGLRVKLELGPGQMLAVNDTDEIILDLNYNYVVKPEKEPEVTEGVTMSGDKGPLPEAAATPVETTEGDDVKARLQKLEDLKKEGLINNKEYKEKRGEILKGL